MTYTTFWKGFGGPVGLHDSRIPHTNIPGCLYKSKSQAVLANRSVVTTENDYINYLTIGY